MTSRYDRWPSLLREVAETLGDQAALKLVAQLGGQRIVISKRAGETRLRDELLGVELAEYLERNFGGEYLRIPNFGARLADERRTIVLQNPNVSANDLAARLGITSRHVERIRAQANAASHQPSLFD